MEQAVGALCGHNGDCDGVLIPVRLDAGAQLGLCFFYLDSMQRTVRLWFRLEVKRASLRGNGGRRRVGGGIQDDGGPDVLAEITQECAEVGFGALVVNQAVKRIGRADPGGEIQCAVFPNDQGGSAGESGGIVDFHVAGNDRIDEIIAVSVLQEHVAAPDVALIVDQIDHFAVCFCVIAVVVLVSDVLATTGGNACQEGNAVFPQADVCKLRIHGIGRRNDGVFTDAINCRRIFCGEVWAVGQIPDPVVLLIVVIRRLDQVFAVLIQKMHRAVFGIQQVEGVSLRDSGNSHRRVL
ncbi:unknown [Firmicutes bacterium CAG:137]|nr:unknown [Firmicutes bacterium CAG:137]